MKNFGSTNERQTGYQFSFILPSWKIKTIQIVSKHVFLGPKKVIFNYPVILIHSFWRSKIASIRSEFWTKREIIGIELFLSKTQKLYILAINAIIRQIIRVVRRFKQNLMIIWICTLKVFLNPRLKPVLWHKIYIGYFSGKTDIKEFKIYSKISRYYDEKCW